MKTAHEILVTARELIDDPEHWGKGSYRRHDGDGTLCYCAIGAVRQVLDGPFPGAYDALHVALPLGFGDIIGFNDHPKTTHADVLAMFDRAIAATAPGDIHTEENES